MKQVMLHFGLGVLCFVAMLAMHMSHWFFYLGPLGLVMVYVWGRKQPNFNFHWSLLTFLVFTSLLGPAILPQSSAFLGLDIQGDDRLIALLKGSQVSLLIAFLTAICTSVIGLLCCSLLTLGPRWLKKAFNFWLQAFLSIPLLIYYLLGLSFLDPGMPSLLLLFSATLWPETTRTLQVHADEYIEADFANTARMMGASELGVFWREVMPNLRPLIIANFMLILATAVLLESILSYLGLGLPVGTASLGRFLEDSVKQMDREMAPLIASAGLLVCWLTCLRMLFRRKKAVLHGF